MKKYYPLWLKTLSMFLTVFMLFGYISVPAFSVQSTIAEMNTDISGNASEHDETTPAEDSTEQVEYMTEVIEMIEGETIGRYVEVVNLRERNVKHFRTPNGTYEAVYYPEAVHRKNEKGEWVDIDNSLFLQGSDNTSVLATSDNRLQFATAYAPNKKLISINENGYEISMSLKENDPVVSEFLQGDTASLSSSLQGVIRDPIVSNPPIKESTFGVDYSSVVKNKSAIKYPSILSNTDIEYAVCGTDIKENIIVNGKRDNYTYTFILNVSGLRAELCDSGRITLSDMSTGRVEYIIPAPYMYDADGEYSYDVRYSLRSVSEGRYELSVIADDAWINAADRVFPIVIDPTVMLNDFTYDTYISSSSPNTNYGYADKLIVSPTSIAFIRTDFYDVPQGATISNATLYVKYYHNVSSGSVTLGAYQVLREWDDDELTWNSFIAHNNFISGTALTETPLPAAETYTYDVPGTAAFSIKSAVEAWTADPDTNYGIALKYHTGSNSSVYIKALDDFEHDHWAYIVVNYAYTVPDGVYGLRNMGNTVNANHAWMKAESANVGSNLQQKKYTSSPVNSFSRENLFKITKKPGADTYIIRSMLDNRMSFSVSENKIIMKEIPANDYTVSLSDTFYIEYDICGFLIRPYGTNTVITGDTTVYQGIATSIDGNLTVQNKDTAGNPSRWELVQYTGYHRNGGYVSYPYAWRDIGFVVGTTGTVTGHSWSTRPNYNSQYLYVDASDSALVSHTVWNSVTADLTISSELAGKVRINHYVKESFGTQGTPLDLGHYEYRIVPQTGTYVLFNIQNKGYLDIEWNSKLSGAPLQQYRFTGNDPLKWYIEHVPGSDGYIRIKSFYSNLYAGVDSSDTSIIRQYSSAGNYMLWEIDRTSSGNYKFTCKGTQASGLVLAAPVSTVSAENLTQIQYTDDSNYRDEWVFWATTKIIPNVPHNVTSTDAHLCIPCAINHLVGYWYLQGYTGFGASSESRATQIHNRMGDGRIYRECIPAELQNYSHNQNGETYTLNSVGLFKGDFEHSDIFAEINAGNPFLLSFSKESSYGDGQSGHVTVCAGYEIVSGKVKVYLSDAWKTDGYAVKELNIDTYNDYICKVKVVH